ncbi:MAG: hypothetical protein Aureis2KO_10620 [Aureisphaera sp.]
MKLTSTLLFLFVVSSLYSQKNTSNTYTDVETIVNETQRIISIEKGQVIDTASFRKLFLPTAHFTVVGNEDGTFEHETMQLNTFLEMLTDEYYSNGYYETGTGEVIERFHGIAHVMQGFYGQDSEGTKGWGVNSYQLIFSQGRWWIANMIWTMSEDEGEDIPKKYRKTD